MPLPLVATIAEPGRGRGGGAAKYSRASFTLALSPLSTTCAVYCGLADGGEGVMKQTHPPAHFEGGFWALVVPPLRLYAFAARGSSGASALRNEILYPCLSLSLPSIISDLACYVCLLAPSNRTLFLLPRMRVPYGAVFPPRGVFRNSRPILSATERARFLEFRKIAKKPSKWCVAPQNIVVNTPCGK